MRKIILITMLLFFSCLFSGCTQTAQTSYSTGKISRIIQNNLQEKYNEKFTVQSIKEVDEGINFSNMAYYANCISESSVTPFSVRIEKDGTNMTDNYEGYFYKDIIDEDIKNILSRIDYMEFYYDDSVFNLTDIKYGSAADYIKSGNVDYVSEIDIHATTKESVLSNVSLLIDSLQEKHYGFNFAFHWNDKTVYFIRGGNEPEFTRQDIERKFFYF